MGFTGTRPRMFRDSRPVMLSLGMASKSVQNDWPWSKPLNAGYEEPGRSDDGVLVFFAPVL